MLRQKNNSIINENKSKKKEIVIKLEKKLQELHPKKIDLSLDRINKHLSKLGNPQKKIIKNQ